MGHALHPHRSRRGVFGGASDPRADGIAAGCERVRTELTAGLQRHRRSSAPCHQGWITWPGLLPHVQSVERERAGSTASVRPGEASRSRVLRREPDDSSHRIVFSAAVGSHAVVTSRGSSMKSTRAGVLSGSRSPQVPFRAGQSDDWRSGATDAGDGDAAAGNDAAAHARLSGR